jgi:Ca2+-binding EF-hand superfamily protein
MMRAMGRNPTEEELINIMNEIDVDHNGNNVNYLVHIHLKQNITLMNAPDEIRL